MPLTQSYPSMFWQQFHDENGDPLANGTVKTFLASDHSMPVQTYTYPGSGVRNPTNITLDAAGKCLMALEIGLAYYIEVYDVNNNLKGTFDNVTAGGDGVGLADIEVTSDDNSVTVNESTVGDTKVYDLSVRAVPSSTSADEGKILSVDDSGKPEWVEPPTYTQVQSDWDQSNSSAVDYIKNKPTIPAAQVNSDWDATSGVAKILNKPSLATVATSGSYSDLTGTPTFVAGDNIVITESGSIITIGATVPESAVFIEYGSNTYTNKQIRDMLKAGRLVIVYSTVGYYTTYAKPTYMYNIASDTGNVCFSAVEHPAGNADVHLVKIIQYFSTSTGWTTGNYELSQADWNASSGAARILNKPSLATVATSGSYTDLSNTPTIPAAQVQSDWSQSNSAAVDYIKNKPTIPAAQVQSDWDQSNSAAVDYIKNKPTIRNVPAVTSTDDSKVLTASYSGGVGFYSWETASGGTVTDVEVNGTSVVNASGVAEVTVPAQVNSDWTAVGGVAQILNKPTINSLVAGNNITITESGSATTISATQSNSDWNASSGVTQILNKPESKYFLWDTTSANGFDIWANIYDASDHYSAYLPICLLEDDPSNPGYNHAILHTNFSSTQQSGITVYSDAMITSYLTRNTSTHLALSKGLWYYEFAIELVPTQLVSGIADMTINIYSQVYDTPSSIPSYYMVKNINAPVNCNVQSTYTRMISGVIYSIRDFTFDSQGFLSFGQTLSVNFDLGRSTIPSGAAFKFRQTGLHLVKLGV